MRSQLRPVPWWLWVAMAGQYALGFAVAWWVWWLSPLLTWAAMAEFVWAASRQARWVMLQRDLRQGALRAHVVVEGRPAVGAAVREVEAPRRRALPSKVG